MMKALLLIVTARGRTGFPRMWKTKGFFPCLHVKRKIKSKGKEEVALNPAKNELFDPAVGEGPGLGYCVSMFLPAQNVEKFSE